MTIPVRNQTIKTKLESLKIKDSKMEGGFIKLANYGHDVSAILITSGQPYAKFWLLGGNSSITPFYKNLNGREPGVGFLDWFENLLHENLVSGAPRAQF